MFGLNDEKHGITINCAGGILKKRQFSRGGSEDQELSFGHAKTEMYLRHGRG